MSYFMVFVVSLWSVSTLALDFSITDPYTISADESNNRVLQLNIPNTTTIAVAFTGCDVATAVHKNTSAISKKIVNDGRTVILKTGLGAYVDKLYPVTITTKQGRTHTLALVTKGPEYKLSEIQIKVVIQSGNEICK